MGRKKSAYEKQSFKMLDELATAHQCCPACVDKAKEDLRKRLIGLHRDRRRLDKAQAYIRNNL